MRIRSRRRGLTLVEVLLVAAIVAMLGATAFFFTLPARKAARLSSCRGYLRQMGMAYQMYVNDFGIYPRPHALKTSSYIRDPRIFFCPEDRQAALLGVGSSYAFRIELPPDLRLLWQVTDVDPGMVLVACQSHIQQRVLSVSGDHTVLSRPEYPYYLTLHADGAVRRIPTDQIRTLCRPAESPRDRPSCTYVYPGEPGYESAERAASLSSRTGPVPAASRSAPERGSSDG